MPADVTLPALSVVGRTEIRIALSPLPDLGLGLGDRDLFLRGRTA